tara:strand:- start:323 stop:820 length:498 start_codon:yes stop_codon:yes gene_type:complete
MTKHTPNRREITDWIGNKRTTWCGPYAIATVCGTSYEPAYQMAKRVRGKRHAKGITCNNLEKACKLLGVKGKWHTLEKRQKCINFLKSDTLKPNTVYVINVTKHFFILDTRDYTTIDNQVPEWIAAESTKHKNKLVVKYFEVENPKFDAKNDDTWLIEPLAAASK